MQTTVAGRSYARQKAYTDRFVVSEDAVLDVGDQVVRVSGSGTDALTVTLPSVVRAKGRIYSIQATIADTAAVTVTDAGDSDDFGGDYTLDADGDAILLYSDGIKWWPLANEIA